MKTHELAKALHQLARILEQSPNVSLDQSSLFGHKKADLSSGQMAVSLATLAELSRVEKGQWVAFINDLRLPIEIRPRDASRDILGKLLNYLESDELAREQLKSKAASRGSQASPELMKALNSLLKEPV